MTKEEIVNSFLKVSLENKEYDLTSLIYKCMSQYADQEKEKVAILFSNWRNEYVNELTYEYMIYTKGSEPAIIVNSESDLYQYWIENIYNQNQQQ